MNYTIFSDTPCICKILEQSFELNESNCLYFKSEENLTLHFYPLAKNILPSFYETKNALKTEYGNYILPEFTKICSGEIQLIKNFNGKYAKLTGKPYKFSVFDNKNGYFYEITHNISDFEITSINNKPALTANVDGEDYLLLFYNNKFYEFLGKIETNTKNLQAVTRLNTIAKHGLYTNLDFSGNPESQLLYLENEPKLPKNQGSKNYCFLESIKYSDFHLARTFLSQTLNQKLSDEHLKRFFGDFEKIIPLTSTKFLLIKKADKNLSADVYNFELENGNIFNIN